MIHSVPLEISVVFNPCALVPFFVFFYFILFFLDNGVKEIEPCEGLYIKEGLFCADSLFGGLCKQKINPTAIDVLSWYRLLYKIIGLREFW